MTHSRRVQDLIQHNITVRCCVIWFFCDVEQIESNKLVPHLSLFNSEPNMQHWLEITDGLMHKPATQSFPSSTYSCLTDTHIQQRAARYWSF